MDELEGTEVTDCTIQRSICQRNLTVLEEILVSDDVLFLIISACIPKFDVSINATSIKVSEAPGQWTWVKGPIKAEGIPDLTYLKLVSRRFCSQVWPALCADFQGELILNNGMATAAEIISCANNLFTGRLRLMAPRLTRIFDCMVEPEAYNDLSFHLFPALKHLTLSSEPRKSIEDLAVWSAYDMKSSDPEVLALAAQELARNSAKLPFLDMLREKGVRIIFRYHFASIYGVWDTYYHVDVSRPEKLSVVRRECDEGQEYLVECDEDTGKLDLSDTSSDGDEDEDTIQTS